MKKKIGLSRTPPQNEARILGTPKARALGTTRPRGSKPLEFPTPAFVPTAAYVETEVRTRPEPALEQVLESILGPQSDPQKVVDNVVAPEVGSLHQDSTAQPIPEAGQVVDSSRSRTMILTLKTLSKNGKQAYYSGAAQVIRFALGAFPNKVAPQTIDVSGDVFAPAKEPKVKETKEERKARLAAMPKPTEAERIAKAEAALAKRKAKLEAAGASM